ncbi:MAG: thioredoxin [Candidatus Heimdallarchaeota archaeon]|jgi:thioredoxin|nr:thioredoxin [Candidatus Heimdallarchaeota archaeon]MCK4254738.1 thioredoxin [Candidatus Heimdallarchaeota archaeon]
MGNVSNITTDEFNEILKNESKLIIVDTWAPWCGPCKGIEPLFEQLAEKHSQNMRFVRMNMDEEYTFAQKYMVQSLPTFIIFKEGKPYSSLIGANRGKLSKLIEETIKKN